MDVRVESDGEMLDPALFNFKTKESWPDDKTIKLVLDWENPTAISASQPEETLMIGFYGPFFDKEDGLPL